MIDDLEFRESTPDDLQAIEALNQDAFPTEDLLPLVRELLDNREDVLSLVATISAFVIAHVIFTKCSIEGHGAKCALLGPLAVGPVHQKNGIGTAIVRRGIHRLKDDRINHVFVLGDPAYYRRFGFSPEAKVTTPYPLPAEWRGAWQSVRLGADEPIPTGTIQLPTPWLRKELWVP